LAGESIIAAGTGGHAKGDAVQEGNKAAGIWRASVQARS
jgi:hypothetical protein